MKIDKIRIKINMPDQKPIQNDKDISFLIGSGFSRPYGFTTVSELNEMFTELDVDDVVISLIRTVHLVEDQVESNEEMNINERRFFIEFIDDYVTNYQGGTKFHYEEFYDYYYSRYRGGKSIHIDEFCEKFRNKYHLEDDIFSDTTNLLLSFNNIFSQLIANKLIKPQLYENGVHRNDYRGYNTFLKYLDYLTNQGYSVHLFTLNHDLLLDYMCSNSNLWDKYCDGFTYKRSPYFGDLEVKNNHGQINKYKVRLKYFANEYDKPIRLYKLHGSIDNHIMNIKGGNGQRIKDEYGVFDFYKEIEDGNKGFIYERSLSNLIPDYLSGTTEKIRSYYDDFYSVLFDHFNTELPFSEALIVIGYGFWDSGINEFLQKNIINHAIPVSVIDPYPPGGDMFKENEGRFKLIQKSATDVTLDELKSIIS